MASEAMTDQAFVDQCCQPYRFTCTRCVATEEQVLHALSQGPLRKIINGDIEMFYSQAVDRTHLEVLKPVLHMHPKLCA